jgi:predicted Fe-Mo cluster-binding NifX family protein
MKVAIPLVKNQLSSHFGHCEAFALLEVDDATKTITQQTRHDAPPHEPELLPKWLHGLGANVIIAGGMGQRAMNLFYMQGIHVVLGITSGTPEQLVLDYLQGTLKSSANLCDH